MKIAREHKDELLFKQKIDNVKRIYNGITIYPKNIDNGWYDVIVTNGIDFLEERKVLVENNIIKKNVLDNWFEVPVDFSGIILNGKTTIKEKKENNNIEYLEVFFLDLCLNPNLKINPPLKPGKISFWTNWKKTNSLTVFMFDNIEIGKITKFFVEEPNCDEEGTVTILFKPGIYNFSAHAITLLGFDTYWNGQVEIKENECTFHCLIKK
jgi:hypothetical protein